MLTSTVVVGNICDKKVFGIKWLEFFCWSCGTKLLERRTVVQIELQLRNVHCGEKQMWNRCYVAWQMRQLTSLGISEPKTGGRGQKI